MSRRRIAATLALATLATCSREPTAPMHGAAHLAVAPVLPKFAAALGLSIDQARIIVVQPPADTLLIKLITFPAGQDTISPDVTVPLQQDSEDLDVTIELLAGGTVVFTGSQTVSAHAGGSVTPTAIPLVYQEPGAHVTSLTIGPRDSGVSLKDTVHLRVTALDAGDATVTQFYVLWSVSDTTAATVSKSGVLVAGSNRRTVYVRAQIPPTTLSPLGITDSTSVVVVPTPTQIARVSGDSQAGAVGTALALPLTVLVRAADNLPVPGATVTFAALTGGGSVLPLTAITDTAGRASSVATLGATPGANTFGASINGGAVSTAFDATANPAGPVIPTWNGSVSTDWSIPGNWSPAGVPLATDDVVVPAGPVNLPVLTTFVGVKGLTVAPSASIDLGGQTLTANGNVVVGGAILGTGSLVIAGSGVTIAGALSSVIINSSGTVSLAGNTTLSGDLTLDAGDLVVAGHALGIAGGLTLSSVSPDHFTMTDPADSVDVAGAVNWDPDGDEGGHLTNGVLVLRSTFFQGGPISDAFTATGSHRTVFAGSGAQSIDPRGAGFQFQNLEIRGSGSVSVLSNTLVAGRTSVLSATTLGNGATLTSLGRLSSVPGSTVAMGGLIIDADSLAIGGTYGVTNTTFTNGSTLPVLAYASLDINRPAGTITLVGNTNISGNLTIDGGELLVAGHSLGIAGTLSLNGATSVFLTMTNPADSVDVGGAISWDAGGDHTGHLTAGVLVVRGTFFQGGPSNGFVATAAQRTVFAGSGSQSIDPRGSGFQFQTLEVRGSGSVSVLSNTLVAGRTSVLSATALDNGATLTSIGRLSSVPGSTVATGGLIIDADSLAIGGSYGVTNTTFTNGSILPVLAYSNLDINRPAGTMTLAGNTNLSGNLNIDGGELLIAGHTLGIAGGLSLNGAATVFLTMTNPTDSVDVGGLANWDPGADQTGHLSAGVLVLRGSFFQGGPSNGFVATAAHRTVFAGTSSQSIDPRGSGFQFQTLEIRGSGVVNVLSNTLVAGRTSVLSATTLGNGATLNSFGRLSSVPGSTVATGGLIIDADSLAIGGSYGVTSTTIINGSTLPVLAYANLDINRPAGIITLAGNTNLTGNLNMDGGELVVGGHSLTVGGSLAMASSLTDILDMTNAADSVDVLGSISWTPSQSHLGHLTAGVLVARDNFFEGGANDTAFAATGTHRTVFDGAAAQTIDPRGAAFHFQNLEIRSTAGVSILSPTTVAGQLISASPAVSLNGGSIQTAAVNVSGLTLNGVALKLIEPVGVAEKFDNVTFTGYATNVAQITIQGPGGAAAPRTLTFNNLTFMPLTAGDLGTYVTLFSSNGFGLNLSLPGASQSPQIGGNGPTFSSPANQVTVSGATILWP